MLQSKIAQFNIKQSIQLIQNEKQETGTFFMINSIRGDDVYSDSVNIWIQEKYNMGVVLGFLKKFLKLDN